MHLVALPSHSLLKQTRNYGTWEAREGTDWHVGGGVVGRSASRSQTDKQRLSRN